MTQAQAKQLQEPELILQISSLSFDWPPNWPKSFTSAISQKKLLNDVNLILVPGQFVGLGGPMASGKTTLLRLSSGFLKPSAGKIKNHSKRRAMIYHDGRASLDPQQTVATHLSEALWLCRQAYSRVPGWQLAAIEAIFDELGLETALLKCKSQQLSHGECHLIAIARAFLQCPDLLLADDPWSLVNTSTQERLGCMLAKRKTEYGMAAILVHGFQNLPSGLCDRVLCLDNGILLEASLAET